MTTSFEPFTATPLAPADPILGIKQTFLKDPRTTKVDLSIGVYLTERGLCEKLPVVREAEGFLADQKRAGEIPDPADYLSIDGYPPFISAARNLLLGSQHPAIQESRVATVQSAGGTAALRYAAQLLRRLFPNSSLLLPEPTWPMHRSIFASVGTTIESCPYIASDGKSLAFDELRAALNKAAPHTIVMLHACCHNPTGVDLSRSQWSEILDIVAARSLIPFVDMAYQGFGESLEADVWPIREAADRGITTIAAQSFSKNFSLYSRRIGALHVIASSADVATRITSQIKAEVRLIHSTCPKDGAEIVATILGDAQRRLQWEREVTEMRLRIQAMREALVATLSEGGLGSRFRFLLEQRGMFSYTGLSKEQALALRDSHGVYILESGRVCVAALTKANLPLVTSALLKVLQK